MKDLQTMARKSLEGETLNIYRSKFNYFSFYRTWNRIRSDKVFRREIVKTNTRKLNDEVSKKSTHEKTCSTNC